MASTLENLASKARGGAAATKISAFIHGDSSIDDIISSINKATVSANSSGPRDLEDFIYSFWEVVVGFAITTPHDEQSPLVSLLERLEDSGDVTADNGEAVQTENGVLWKDLPKFPWVMRDAWNYCTAPVAMFPVIC